MHVNTLITRSKGTILSHLNLASLNSVEKSMLMSMFFFKSSSSGKRVSRLSVACKLYHVRWNYNLVTVFIWKLSMA